jgi:hypothetical protein
VRVKRRHIRHDLRGHVLEFPVAQVPVQLARVAEDLLSLEIAAARDEHVQEAVAVVIDQGDPAAERFQDRVFVGFLAIAVAEADSRLLGDVPEDMRTGVRRLVIIGRFGGRTGMIEKDNQDQETRKSQNYDDGQPETEGPSPPQRWHRWVARRRPRLCSALFWCLRHEQPSTEPPSIVL